MIAAVEGKVQTGVGLGLPQTEVLVDPTDMTNGLTTAEVTSLRASGRGNVVDTESSRTFKEIVKDNLFTFLNMTLVGIGLVLVVMGLFRDAIMSSGFALLNGCIGVVQEVIAKRRLDKVALLARATATVVRDGAEVEIDPADLVLGDVLALRAGDQAVIDGVLVGDGSMSMDESLLTGEADAIAKESGDPVYAGSFCVSGTAWYQATRVSAESVASGIVSDAKSFKASITPLQRSVNTIIRLLLAIAFTMLALLILTSVIWQYPFRDTVVAAAVVLGIVPAGLFLMITLTYSMAALRLAKKNALIQQVNAVESLSNVDVFCMDKTGTLTSNALELREVVPLTGDEASARAVLGAMAHGATAPNKTTEAISAACAGEAVAPLDEIPFSSALKWSAVSLDQGAIRGVFALGAPEMLGPLLASPPDGWLDRGLRVLLVASSPASAPLHGEDDSPALPTTMQPLAWLAIADQLRPHSKETLRGFQDAGIEIKVISGDNPETVAALARQAGLRGFQDAGIEIKVISGDNPETVAALARQAGLRGEIPLVSGPQLAAMNETEFDAAALNGRVFGRITPDQKARLVGSLQRHGKYVAMTGDGVNDVMSLKRADLGIAMESGSQATRAVADIVLLKDTFSALPASFSEGQRVRLGLQGVLALFLTRVFVVVIAVLLAAVVRIGFPFSPANITLLTFLTVGIPTFGIALWAHPGQPPRSMMKSLVAFVLPAAVTIAVAAFAVYTLFYLINDVELTDFRDADPDAEFIQQPLARDALTYLLVLSGIMLVPFACPPTKWWAVIERTNYDWRPTLLAIAMIPLYVAIVTVDPVREFFGTHQLEAIQYAVIAGVAVAWLVLLRYVYATHVFERFFGMEIERE